MKKIFLFCLLSLTAIHYSPSVCFGTTSTPTKILATSEEVETAKRLTKEAHERYKTIKFYSGGTYANNALNAAINTLRIDVTADLWRDWLQAAVVNNQCPSNMEQKSKRWIKAYIRFIERIISIIKPIAVDAEEESKREHDIQDNANYSKVPFDHWTTSKDKE